MKTILLACTAFATLSLSACAEDRPAPTHAESGAAHQSAASEAEKSFKAENPADPSQLK